jgi:hypothetical protein
MRNLATERVAMPCTTAEVGMTDLCLSCFQKRHRGTEGLSRTWERLYTVQLQ